MSLGFKLGDRIGKGSFATVFKGKSTSSGEAVAVKVVHRAHLRRDKRLLENFEGEMAILKQMKHPHIVLLYDVAQTENDFYLVMEYCALGDLSYFIRKRKQLIKNLPLVASLYERYPATPAGGLDETVIRHFLAQLGAALRFLRSVNLVHRDIKPQNMLLMPPLDQHEAEAQGIEGLWELPILKVADFGFARFLPSSSMAETLCGSPLYMAPEILNYEKYNAKADLWSVGAVVYEMVASKPPYPAANHIELIKKINESKNNIVFPEGIEASDELLQLIQGLLKRSPTERMGFDEFFAHPALKVLGKQESLNMDSFDGNVYISEYIDPEQNQAQYGVESNPFSSSNESLPDIKTLTARVRSTSGASAVKVPASAPPSAPSLARAGTSAGSTSSPRGSLTRLGNSDDYVVVEKRTVEVNSLADDLVKKEAKTPAFNRRRLSSIAYGTSPTNALAQALIKSSARLFGARVESGTLSIPRGDLPGDLTGFSKIMRPTGDNGQDRLTQKLDALNRMGRVVAVYAELKQSQIHPDDLSQDPTVQDIIAQESLQLYLKALGILAHAMETAAEWWKRNEESTTSQVLKDLVQSIRNQFNDCVDRAEIVRKCILNGDKASPTPMATVEKLLFERALDLARSAAGQESGEDLVSCELNYATALWMLRAIIETEGTLQMSPDDTELVERLSSRIQQRILALRRRLESFQHASP